MYQSTLEHIARSESQEELTAIIRAATRRLEHLILDQLPPPPTIHEKPADEP